MGRLFFTLLFVLTVGLSAFAESPGTAPEVRWPFEVRVFLKFLLHASNLDPESPGHSDQDKIRIFDQAVGYLRQYAEAKPEEMNVTSFAEYLEAGQRNLPDLYTFENEMARLTGTRPLPPVLASRWEGDTSNEAAEYSQKQLQLMHSYMGEVGKFNGVGDAEFNTIGAVFQSLIQDKSGLPAFIARLRNSATPLQAIQWLSRVPLSNRDKLLVVNSFERALQAGIKELIQSSRRVADTSNAKFVNAQASMMVNQVVSTYFEGLTERSQKQILSELMDHPSAMTPIERFGIVVRNAGPQFQKLLQVISREPWLSEQVRTIFKKLESSGKEVPWTVAEKIFHASDPGFEWVHIEPKSMGVGTLGQVHRARIRLDGVERDVAVKFIKPGSEERMDEDKRIFDKIAHAMEIDPQVSALGLPKLGPILEDIDRSNRTDLDLERMSRLQREARKHYNSTVSLEGHGLKTIVEFNVPDVLDSKNPGLLVQELAHGYKPELFREEHPEASSATTIELARLWLKNAVFGSGFFHADMHQGNLLVEVIPERQADGTLVNRVRYHILDHGMDDSISRSEQKAFLSLAAAVVVRDQHAIARILYGLRDGATSPDLAAWRAAVRAKVAEKPNLDIGEWIAFAVKEGIRFPFRFAGFNRGAVTVKGLVTQAGGTDKAITDVLASLGLRNPHRILEALFWGRQRLSFQGMRHLGKELCKRAWEGIRPPRPVPPPPPIQPAGPASLPFQPAAPAGAGALLP